MTKNTGAIFSRLINHYQTPAFEEQLLLAPHINLGPDQVGPSNQVPSKEKFGYMARLDMCVA